MKRKHPTPTRADHRKRSQTQYKQKPVADKTRDVPLSTVFPRLLNDIRSNFASRFQAQTASNPTNKRAISSRATQSNASQVTQQGIQEHQKLLLQSMNFQTMIKKMKRFGVKPNVYIDHHILIQKKITINQITKSIEYKSFTKHVLDHPILILNKWQFVI
ncbi:hypothetical protein YC2023_059986 [Brassica napus]